MRQLNAHVRALAMHKARNTLQARDVLILPDAKIANGNAAFGHNRRGFENHHARAALRARTKMHQVPIGREAIFAGVLAHGRNTDAIGKFDGTELERLKKRNAHGLVRPWRLVINVATRAFDELKA